MRSTSQVKLERNLFINNVWTSATSGEYLTLINPATEEGFGKADVGSEADVDQAVVAARRAFDEGPWPRLSMADRAKLVARFADEIEAEID